MYYISHLSYCIYIYVYIHNELSLKYIIKLGGLFKIHKTKKGTFEKGLGQSKRNIT